MTHDDTLAAHDEFVVRESMRTNFIAAALFFCMFLGILFWVPVTKDDAVFLMMLLAPAIIFTVKGILNPVTLLVDCNGIYQNKQLITSWANFVQAFVAPDDDPDRIREKNTVLILKYQKEDITGVFRRTISFSGTLNKTEEQTLAAIGRFYSLHQSAVMPIQTPLQIGESDGLI